MSELQIALIAAGIVAVLAVWGYNSWQERKFHKAANALFRGDQPDVLMPEAISAPLVPPNVPAQASDERREPGFYADEAVAAIEETAAPAGLPVIDTVEAQVDAAAAPAAAVRADAGWPVDIDELAECVLQFRVEQPVSAAVIWSAQSVWSGAISKPLQWLARTNETSPWMRIDAMSHEHYSDWLAALQLVDRRGSVTDGDLSRFFDGVKELGHQLGFTVETPGRAMTLQRAEQLDAFCAKVDVQIGLSVIHAQGGTFAGTKLRGLCEAAGFELADDGCYHSRNAIGQTEFMLSNIGAEGFDAQGMSSLATNGITLTIDVPRVAEGAVVFNRMILVARQLAQGLGGTLVDSQRAPLSDAMTGLIRAKINELQQVMGTATIPPGSVRARKLFS